MSDQVVADLVKQKLFDLGINLLLFLTAIVFLWLTFRSLKRQESSKSASSQNSEDESAEQYSRHRRNNSRG